MKAIVNVFSSLNSLKISAPDVRLVVRISYGVAFLVIIMLGVFMFNTNALVPKFVWSLVGLISALVAHFVLKQYEKTRNRNHFKVGRNNINWMITTFALATLLNGVVCLF
ncbi:MAG: hypothetical protein ACOYL8_03040 [Patescibacteria group bacterium]